MERPSITIASLFFCNLPAMKNVYYFLSIAFILGACQQQEKEFSLSGKYQDDKLNATVLLQDKNDSTLFSENYKDGKILLKGRIDTEGFHKIVIQFDDKNRIKNSFLVWLSEDSLLFDLEDRLQSYPKIISNNKIQQSLSRFYQLKNEISHESNKKLKQAIHEEKTKGDALTGDAYTQLLYNIDAARDEVAKNYFTTIRKFAAEKPSAIALFKIIQESPETQFELHPDEYVAILRDIQPELKNNEEAQDLIDELQNMSKISIGKKIDLKIEGKDLNGKAFNIEHIKDKKIILLEFWKSSNVVGRTFRPAFKKTYDEFKDKGFEIIGISLDKKEDWWKQAVKDDKVNWPQFTDLKGSESKNIDYYNIKTIPKNILIDGNGKILEIDLPSGSLALELDKYIK